jgi:hypothetical protein
MSAVQVVAALMAAAPAIAVLLLVEVSERRRPVPALTLTEARHREGRQCCTAFYPAGGGYPDRCCGTTDHYGECAP